MEKTISISELEDTEELTVVLDEEGVEENAIAKRTLVGKVLTDKLLNRGAVKAILANGWEDFKELKIMDF